MFSENNNINKNEEQYSKVFYVQGMKRIYSKIDFQKGILSLGCNGWFSRF